MAGTIMLMRIFISWSGTRSQATAEALGPWLKKMIQSVDCWLSTDMERGVKWIDQINKSLDEHSFGIICLTPGNVAKPWINFEAGALSKHLDDHGRLIPYLLDFASLEELRPPLSQFNASVADEDGTWQLVRTLNKHDVNERPEPDLRDDFDLRWPQLKKRLEEIRAMKQTTTRPRSTNDKIDELLSLARSSNRTTAPDRSRATDLAIFRDLLPNTRIYVSPDGRLVTQFDPRSEEAAELRRRQELLEEVIKEMSDEYESIVSARIAWVDLEIVRVSVRLSASTARIPVDFKRAIIEQANGKNFGVEFRHLAGVRRTVTQPADENR